MLDRIRFRALIAILLAAALTGCASSARKPPEPSERQKVAMAMFAERCKKAGEFIYRTVEDVEGVYLMKLRPQPVNYADQFALTDPYGEDLGGDGYIGSFLRGHYEAHRSGTPLPGSPARPLGYLYVEAVDPKDGVRYHYTGSKREVERVASILGGGDGKKFKTIAWALDRAPSSAMPRYGVTYEDISTREEREYWIAGSSLKVVDLQTKEVLGERIGYMVDVAQGSRAGGRSPWLFALDNACPTLFTNPNRLPGPAATASQYRAARFTQKVLKPAIK